MTRASSARAFVFAAALGRACLAAAEIPRPEHPTPDAARPHWTNLNGPWAFRFDPADEGLKAGWQAPGAAGFDMTISVPFGWESELSGIRRPAGAPKVAWYRRSFAVPADFPASDRAWLRFGAVDYRADVWVNGKAVASHEGGYSPFEADVTDALEPGGDNTVVVRAFDPTDPDLPVGKQVGWYTPTSGIWQTVWLESRPKAHIAGFTVTTTVAPAEAGFRVMLEGLTGGAYKVAIRPDDPTVAAARTSFAVSPETPPDRRGRDDVTLRAPVGDPKFWSPESPHLYDVTLELSENGKVIDTVKTYFGLRTIARGRVGDEPFERVLLNGKPVYLRGALDQSFNPKGIYTAPDDEFLKKDILLAKSMGLNFLRIHIKPDEPRRLYWADKLGMMIMEDMPNTWRQNDKARAAWERTMREVVPRDRNHPSIFAWVAFNETWGLANRDPDEYKQGRDTQAWVDRMVGQVRALDPTRLVEDQSPCNYDHIENTDFNSWHFYIDDHAEARRHIDDVVARSRPGSPFNYTPGRVQNTAPLINSEYGGVSAGSGDRDISWSFRDLTTQLRRQPKIQGYVYTELTDIEWEHNGFADYDRTPKDHGYGAFVPGMTPADLNGADFIGYDAPPAIVAKVGETITIPLFVSHYSDRPGPAKLRWHVVGTTASGATLEDEVRERPVEWASYEVTPQKAIAIKLTQPMVGAVALVLEGSDGKKLAANFVNVVARPETPLPRVERLSDNEALIRFSPDEFARAEWSGGTSTAAGKAAGRGVGAFYYRIQLPESVARAGPQSYDFRLEAGARNGRDQVDFADHVNPQDNPQTDGRKQPSTLEVSFNGVRAARVGLDDDPADARGVLSHIAGVDHGSYGEPIRLAGPLSLGERTGGVLTLRLRVPGDAEAVGGLSVYGASTGAFGRDPVLIVRTEDALPADLGVAPDATRALDSVASRTRQVLGSGESSRPTTWAYATADPGEGWAGADFDDKAWTRGAAGFGTSETPGLRAHTRWDGPEIWLRTSVEVPALAPGDALTLRLFHDEDVEVTVNGKPLFRAAGYTTGYQVIPLSAGQKALFRAGPNVIAVHCRQTRGGQGVDLGLTRVAE